MNKKLALLLCLMPLVAHAASRPRLTTVEKVDIQRWPTGRETGPGLN